MKGSSTKVIRPIKSGKEASVHLVRANPRTTGETLAALKVFHPPDRRAFRDEGLYRDGEFIKERRGSASPSRRRRRSGRRSRRRSGSIANGRCLETLFAAGADVPRPIMRSDRALLMTYIGDEDDAAPQLRSYRPDPDEAEELFASGAAQRRAVPLPERHPRRPLPVQHLGLGRTGHAHRPAAGGRSAEESTRPGLLERDLYRVCEHFARFGVQRSAEQLTADMWTAWQFADLVPEELRGLV